MEKSRFMGTVKRAVEDAPSYLVLAGLLAASSAVGVAMRNSENKTVQSVSIALDCHDAMIGTIGPLNECIPMDTPVDYMLMESVVNAINGVLE